MSLILDALKKSAQKKSSRKSPDLLTAHIGAAKQPAERPRWIPYLIIAALLLNAVVLAAWLVPRSSEKATATTTKQEPQPVTSSPATLPQEAAVKPAYEPQAAPPAPSAVPQQEQTRRIIPAHAQEVSAPAPAPKPAPAERTVREVRVIEKSRPESIPEPPPPQGIVGISDLPSSVRRGLPDMSMSAHVYTPEKEFRLVQIQGKTLREGQSLSSGLVLDEVTIDGAVFRYKGYRFSLKMF